MSSSSCPSSGFSDGRVAAPTPDPSQWDVAKQQYQAIIDDPKATDAYKDYATTRLELIAKLRQPPAINVPPLGTTRPAILGPAVRPATR